MCDVVKQFGEVVSDPLERVSVYGVVLNLGI